MNDWMGSGYFGWCLVYRSNTEKEQEMQRLRLD